MQQEIGAQLWKGNVRISGYRNALVIPCVAVPYNSNSDSVADMRMSSGWPHELMCDSFKLKKASQIGDEVNRSQMYVRFVPVDRYGKEMDEPKLGTVAAVLMERGLVFEVPCTHSSSRGTLFLWSTHSSMGQYSLIGGFKPSYPP